MKKLHTHPGLERKHGLPNDGEHVIVDSLDRSDILNALSEAQAELAVMRRAVKLAIDNSVPFHCLKGTGCRCCPCRAITVDACCDIKYEWAMGEARKEVAGE